MEREEDLGGARVMVGSDEAYLRTKAQSTLILLYITLNPIEPEL